MGVISKGGIRGGGGGGGGLASTVIKSSISMSSLLFNKRDELK